MKKQTLIILIIGVMGMASSCGPVNPPQEEEEVTAETCLKAMLQYYPYSIDETFEFVNEEAGRTWKGSAYDRANKGAYPYTYISNYDKEENGEKPKSYGDWDTHINAFVLENGVDSHEDKISQVSTYIHYADNTDLPIYSYWNIDIRLSHEEFFTGTVKGYYDLDNVLSQFTDTIEVPIGYQRGEKGLIPAPEGAYARIVKGKGLTDFSVDGETVWRRVK